MSRMLPDVAHRLTVHKAALEAFGIAGLDDLDPMRIEGSVLVAPTGLTSARLPDLYAGDAVVRASWVPDASRAGGWREVPRTVARQLRTESPPTPAHLPFSYWAAPEIVLPAGTTVVLPHPMAYLTVVTQRLVVGENVTFTWQRPDVPVPGELPPPPPRPDRPAQAPDGSYGRAGERGIDGRSGNGGFDGGGGPTLELWTLELEGTPSFDVQGQDGGPGGRGQPGGQGGRGARGRPAHSTTFDCRRGPGFGGRGGDGGRGGVGGQGGDGGVGGLVRLYAPAEVLSAYTAGGFLVLAGGGARGPGGDRGRGGPPGQGGDPGAHGGRCRPDPDRRGAPGLQGSDGDDGLHGNPGAAARDAIRLTEIDQEAFRQALTAPAIVDLEPRTVRAGDVVNLTGRGLSADDELLVNDAPVAVTSFGDSWLTFVVPVTRGGRAEVRVRQRDDTLSNPENLLVLPVLTDASPRSDVVPGATVTLLGSGFTDGMVVRGNGQDMPGVTVHAPDRLEVTLLRPAAVTRDAIAEQVDVRALLPTGQESDPVRVSLDTFRIAVIGDSVAWGQGLEDHERASTLVLNELDTRFAGGRGVYVHSRAHSGACIGVGDDRRLPPLHGEVPASHPTALQQLDALEHRAGVELVVVSAGINDLNFLTVVNPLTERADLDRRIDQHLHRDMGTLLDRTLRDFPQADVVVTGYFPILSGESNLGLVEPFLAALGLFTGAGAVSSALLWNRLDHVLANCWFFYERSRQALQEAVDEANGTLGGRPRVALAAPQFTARNAALAPESWLFGISFSAGPGGLLPGPADSPAVARPRAVACELAGGDPVTMLKCKLASSGHPNQQGAHQYARAIVAAAQTLGRIPSGARADATAEVTPSHATTA